MTLAFFSSTLNHHQLPFCLEMEQLLGKGNFTFVSSIPLTDERKALGFPDLNQQYGFVLKSYENIESYNKASLLASNCDVAIFGVAPEEFVKSRLLINKLTFRYQERIFRKTRWKILLPWVFITIVLNHSRYFNKQLYMLCAGGFTAGDYKLGGAYINKCFKWGYFPAFETFDIIASLEEKKDTKIEILWIGRFINLKHPEKAVIVADYLRTKGYDFHLKMIGEGDMKEAIKNMVTKKQLNDYITVDDSVAHHLVREHMKKAHIFLFTSDKKEGWGVVLNEAMNCGCAVVANYNIGSVKYLIKNGENGLVYNGDVMKLCGEVEKLILDKELRNMLSRNAYDTIISEWNPKNASKKLIKLIDDLIKKRNGQIFTNGVLSKDKGNLF